MDFSYYNKINEAFTVAIKFIVPPTMKEFRKLMIDVFKIPYKPEEFNRMLEVDGIHSLTTKLVTEIRDNVFGALLSNSKYNTLEYYNLVESIFMKSVDFTIKDGVSEDNRDKIIALDLAIETAKEELFIANLEPNEMTEKIYTLLDKRKKSLLEEAVSSDPQTDLYYWPYEKAKLIQLSKDLVEHNFIETPTDIFGTFRDKENNSRPKIQWKAKSDRALFVLLFYIYNENQNFNREPILYIANKLFIYEDKPLKNSKPSYNSHTNYNKIKDKLDDLVYIQKKHEMLYTLISKLELSK